MLIKEYRIPLPMSVDEYRIAQLYMIQKKSRLESTGEGSGVEILENHPYRSKDGECGQYTKKIYHIGNHLPSWLKAILPKSALRVEEEAWNAYPYTKMRTTCPFVEKFYVDVETYYLPDAGQTENVFNLSPTELSYREVDLIDPIVEDVLPGDYSEEEDPLMFKSEKTGRGPMPTNWLEQYQTDKPPSSVMCAYKLIKVEFRYWGMQNKIEHFIHSGLRRPMLMGHRQAWVWQDEWFGLTIEDIRQLEEETRAILNQTMGKQIDSLQLGSLSDRESDQEGGFANTESRGSVVHVPTINIKQGSIQEVNGSKLELISKYSLEDSEDSSPVPPVEIKVERHDLEREGTPMVFQERDQENLTASNMRDSFPRSIRPLSFRDSKRGSVTSYESASASLPPCVSRRMSCTDVMKGWQMTSIETSESTSEDEFFDAQEELDSPTEGEPIGTNLLAIQNVGLSNSFKSLELDSDSSRGSRESLDSLGSSIIDHSRGIPYVQKEKLCKKVSDTSTCSISACKITTLLLVVHGGSQLDSDQDSLSKEMDCELLKESFQTVIKTHYRGAVGRIAIRLVECPAVCSKSLNILSQLCPYVENDSDTVSCNSGAPISSSFPISAIPLMVTASPNYDEMVATMIGNTNRVYHDFIRSEEGQGFNGETCIIGDCMGALLVYDALITFRGRTGSINSNNSYHISYPPNSSNSSLNGDSVTGSPKAEKPRRISAHIPPNKNSLATSKGLRMCVSSGNIRENLAAKSEERSDQQDSPESPPIDTVGRSLRQVMENKNSCDGLNLSLDSIDQVAFDFEVSKFFAFGSPIGLVIGSRKFMQGDDCKALPPRPSCSQFYNLFHPFDPSASRIEPLILPVLSQNPSINVPRYHHFPLGDGQSHFLRNTMAANPEMFSNQVASPRLSPRGLSRPGIVRHDSNMSTSSISSLDSIFDSKCPEVEPGYHWWGQKRLDYALYCPEGLQQFPTAVLSPLFHVSYWESSDVAAFVVREVLHGDWSISNVSSPSKRGMTFSPSQPRERWLRRRTAIKIKNLNSNHRANDSVVMEGNPQILTARFMYGPLDMVSLTGEKIDIYVMIQPPSGEYVLFDTVITASGGRLVYTIQEDKILPVGIFPLKMVVRGDHTWVDSNLAVLPAKTEAVVFSIDGSFTASVSIRGKDPKVRAGAVDVVRHWQELGFLIIYVTSRPDFQKHKVMSWLAEHNFPYGLVAFGDGITKEIQKHKTEFLRKVISEAGVVIHAAYGSIKDVSVYSSVGLKPDQIFCVAKHYNRKYERQAQFLKEGYAVHLNDMSSHQISRPSAGNSRLILRRGCFGLPTRSTKTRHKQLKRTSSDSKQKSKGAKSLELGQPDGGQVLSGTFNYSSFRQTKGLSIAKIQ